MTKAPAPVEITQAARDQMLRYMTPYIAELIQKYRAKAQV